MSRKHWVNPPTLGNIPAFLKKRFFVKYIRQLIKWAWSEYETGLQYLTEHASSKAIRFFIDEYSAMRVLAESEAFREAIEYIDNNNYGQLTARERVFVRRAYELYTSLR
jgi:hypothetical protein